MYFRVVEITSLGADVYILLNEFYLILQTCLEYLRNIQVHTIWSKITAKINLRNQPAALFTLAKY